MGRSPGFAQRMLEVASLARSWAAAARGRGPRRGGASPGAGAAGRHGGRLRCAPLRQAAGGIALLCGALGLALAGAQVANAAGPQLRWEAPVGCPDEAALREGLDRALRSVPAARRDASDLQARARVQETALGRYELELEITANGGVSTRRVEASSCEELADAATLLIAMVIDPTAGAGPAQARTQPPGPTPVAPATPSSEPPRPPEPTPQAEPRPEEPADPPAPPPRARQAPLRVGVGAQLVLGGAGLPGFGAGAGLHVAVLRRHLRAEVFARYHLPRTRALAGLEETGAAVRYDLVEAGVRGCGLGEVGARVGVELFGCVGVELGAMRGVGRALPVSASHTGLWAAALLTPGLAIPVTPRLAVVARGDLGVALSRPRFAVLNYGDAHRAPAVTYAISLGIELRAPSAPLRRRGRKTGTDPAARGQSPREPPSR